MTAAPYPTARATAALHDALAHFPRASLSHLPTPLEPLSQLSADAAPHTLSVKRDDCTGLAMGGNKARQLEFYLGEAVAQGCDTVLSTGAVQSNYMRMLAAAAAKLGLQCHVQLEARVEHATSDYHRSGNVLLNHLHGAHVHYADGGDEADAHDSLTRRAAALGAACKPYIIPLQPRHPPLGALGYVAAAAELAQQIRERRLPMDLLVVASGSGMTHAGLLCGLRMIGMSTPVLGVCVRRAAAEQHPRVLGHCTRLADMLGHPGVVRPEDVWVDDSALAPGYGQASAEVVSDVRRVARREGLLTDPVYSGKAFSCVLQRARQGRLQPFHHIVLIHTGGTAAVFAYRREMTEG